MKAGLLGESNVETFKTNLAEQLKVIFKRFQKKSKKSLIHKFSIRSRKEYSFSLTGCVARVWFEERSFWRNESKRKASDGSHWSNDLQYFLKVQAWATLCPHSY